MFFLCGLLIGGSITAGTAIAQEKGTQDETREVQKTTIKELTIRNSGFRSRASVIIRYRDEDKSIVEVIENGKKLPASEFPRYEEVMRKILELPQIDRLLPEIDRVSRRAESPRISEESKIRDMMEIRRRLERMDSDVARRYREINEVQLMNQLNTLTEKISESDKLSQEEKIRELKALIEKIHTMESARQTIDRRRRLTELGTINASRRLLEEINKSNDMSREEKIKEIQELLNRSREMDLIREKGRGRNLVEFEAANTMREILREISKSKDMSDEKKAQEFKRVLEEAQKMKSENMRRMIGIEKFRFELEQLLKKEGLLPEGKAEFILRSDKCLINGKKLPDEIHKKILQISKDSLGRGFERGTKIVLQLNENR